MISRFAERIGRYRLVLSGELLAFIEEIIVAAAPEAARDAQRAAALHEAAGSELEVRHDGTIISSAHGTELFRTVLGPDERERSALAFVKGSSAVSLEWPDPNTIVARQVGKPVTVFRRLSGAPRSRE